MNFLIARVKVPTVAARLTTEIAFGGSDDNTINRYKVMSSSEHHMRSVPMAIERRDAAPPADNAKSRVH